MWSIWKTKNENAQLISENITDVTAQKDLEKEYTLNLAETRMLMKNAATVHIILVFDNIDDSTDKCEIGVNIDIDKKEILDDRRNSI